MKNKRSHILALLLLVITAVAVAACAGSDITLAKRATGRNPQVGEVPDPDETVRGDTDPPIVTLDLGKALHEYRLSGSEELPSGIIIPTTNLNAVPITSALQAILSGTDVSMSWDTGELGDRLVTVYNLSGPLPKVVDKICSAAKVFCDYRHGSLELAEKETFIVALPPTAKGINTSTTATSTTGSSSGSTSTSLSSSSTANSMVDAISQLTGDKVQIDDAGGNVIYTTTVDGEDRVKQYLMQLRNGRPLVVLQMHIWEVTLNRENSQGINWSQFQLPKISAASTALALSSTTALTSQSQTSGNVSVGAITTGALNTNSVISFLGTKGRVQTISSPQVTFVSGSSAELKVGGTQRYISQVGQLVASTNVSGTTGTSSGSSSGTNGVGSNTVSTDSIDTGLTVDVAGSYENGVVFATLALSLKNLVSLNPTSSGGGTIDLPQTTDEKINTVIRVRPGDNLVLAGLVSSNDTNTRQGIPLGETSSVPLYGDDILQNHELVVIIKPSIVLFSDHQFTEEAKKQETSKPLPDAVVIDKDGSRTVTLPQTGAGSGQVATSSSLTQVQPELMVPASSSQGPIGYVPISQSEEGAPVDKRLMQRGFSHAFDDLLKSSTSASGFNAPSTGGTHP